MLIFILCVILILGIFGISSLNGEKKKGESNDNQGTSVTVDDTTDNQEIDDKNIVEDEIDLWIEPSKDIEKKPNSSTHVEKNENSNNKQEATGSSTSKQEDSEDKKQEWIGGDF